MIDYPELLHLENQNAYQVYFETTYCRGPIQTFDGIKVRFRKRTFFHAFFESSHRRFRKDDIFSQDRAERMAWIKVALGDSHADLRVGYDSKTKSEAKDRRVVIVKGNFVVIIRLTTDEDADEQKAEFVTCYVASTGTIQAIRRSRKWPRKSDTESAQKNR